MKDINKKLGTLDQDKCSCKTRAIILKAIYELCPLLTQNFCQNCLLSRMILNLVSHDKAQFKDTGLISESYIFILRSYAPFLLMIFIKIGY
jgi:hypothetical protein